MRNIRAFVVTLLVVLAVTAPCWARYGAIAWSRSTGRYGTSWNCYSRAEAENIALRKCNSSDGRIRVWVSSGWAALAVTRGGAWGVGWSTSSRAAAERIALDKCGYGSYILCWISSGGG